MIGVSPPLAAAAAKPPSLPELDVLSEVRARAILACPARRSLLNSRAARKKKKVSMCRAQPRQTNQPRCCVALGQLYVADRFDVDDPLHGYQVRGARALLIDTQPQPPAHERVSTQPQPCYSRGFRHGEHGIVKPRPWPPSGTHPPPGGVVPFQTDRHTQWLLAVGSLGGCSWCFNSF